MILDGLLELVYKIKKEKLIMMYQLEMLSIWKNMVSVEIKEIDVKLENFVGMRKIIFERLVVLEKDEVLFEYDSGFFFYMVLFIKLMFDCSC